MQEALGGFGDAISSVKFANDSDNLLVSCWDGSVSLHDTQSNSVRCVSAKPLRAIRSRMQPQLVWLGLKVVCKFAHKAAVLDCCFGDSGHVAYSGGLDRSVHRTDMAAEADLLLGAHSEAVKCLSYAPELRVAVSGSWDKSVKLWDCRHAECSSSHELPDKVYTMAISGFRLVTGTAGVHTRLRPQSQLAPSYPISRCWH